MILKIFSICQCILVTTAMSHKPEINLSQSIIDNGHHSNLLNSLQFDSNSKSLKDHCTLCLHQVLPSSVYVNSDQLNELRRLNQLSACALEQVDVEKPEHLSEELNVYVYSSINDAISLNLPIHLRYHSAKVDGGYEKINIPKPSLFIYCNITTKEDTKNYLLPCSACDVKQCNWSKYSYNEITHSPNVLQMPVGNLQHYYIVLIITLLTTCLGCVYISTLVLRTCSNNKNNIKSKKK